MSWAIQPVVFHNKHGRNVKLSQNNTVATRVRGYDYGIVCTSEPVSIGQMFQVTVLEKADRFVGGFGVYFTTEDPQNLGLINSSIAFANTSERVNLIGRCGRVALHRLRVLGKFIPHTQSVRVGASIGIMLTTAGVLRCFVNGESCGLTTVADYPTDQPLWGVVDVYGSCKRVRAHICTSTIQRNPQQLIADLEKELQELKEKLEAEKENNVFLHGQVMALEQQCQDKQDVVELEPKGMEEQVRGKKKIGLDDQLVKDLDILKKDAEGKADEIDKLKGELAEMKEQLVKEEKDHLQRMAQVKESEQQLMKELDVLKTETEGEIDKLKTELAQTKEQFVQAEKDHLEQTSHEQESTRHLEKQLRSELESWKVNATNKDNRIDELERELIKMKEELDRDRVEYKQQIAQEQEKTKTVEVKLKEEQETWRIEAERKQVESELHNHSRTQVLQERDRYRQALLHIRETAKRTLELHNRSVKETESDKENCHPQLQDHIKQQQVSQEGVKVETQSDTCGVQYLQRELEKKSEEIQKQTEYIDDLQAQIQVLHEMYCM